MSRTGNTTPYRHRTDAERRKRYGIWLSRKGAKEKQARAHAYWGAIRAEQRATLLARNEPSPAQPRHGAKWAAW